MKQGKVETTPAAVTSEATGSSAWRIVRSWLLLGLVIGTFASCVLVPPGGDSPGYYSRGYYHHGHYHHDYYREEDRHWG